VRPQHFRIFLSVIPPLPDPPLSRKGHVPFKPDFGPVPEPPPETNQRFHAQSSFLPKEPVPAVAQLVSVRGIAFNPVQANEPSPTAPLQASVQVQLFVPYAFILPRSLDVCIFEVLEWG
jgi:hypothetical protein